MPAARGVSVIFTDDGVIIFKLRGQRVYLKLTHGMSTALLLAALRPLMITNSSFPLSNPCTERS